MSPTTAGFGNGTVTDRVAELRAGFNRSFAEPPRRHDDEFDELLAIRAGERRYALRLRQTSGLYSDRKVTPLPGPIPALLGVAGFSGTIVPVYDLGALLGHPVAETPRWLAVAAGTPAVALAFHDLDGHVRVPTRSIIGETAGHGLRDCVRGMVPLPGGTRPIIDVPSVRTAVNVLTGHPNQES
jgi:chemotaxis signal transduction protein